MGCDIHMVLERKSSEGKWVGLNNFQTITRDCFDYDDYSAALAEPELDPEEPSVPLKNMIRPSQYLFWKVRGRNYELFGRLAGVRREGPEPRGIPSDVSELARMLIDDWAGDGHSHSWGLLSEIGGLFLAHNDAKKILDENRIEKMLLLFGVIEDGEPEDYRLVYFFDN